MTPRRYFTLILSATLALVVGAYGLAWWLQPVYGDLTRIGGYAERDFGWNAPMQEFSPLAAAWGNNYNQPADVLVIGDSFAYGHPSRQWQNWLGAMTGWRILTLDKHSVDIDQLVGSPLYRNSPPRLVIWNTIERDLKSEYTSNDGQCGPYLSQVLPVALPLSPKHTTTHIVARPMDIERANPGFARAWIWKNILREYAQFDTGDALLFWMNRTDLFTSRLASGLLIFRSDLNKQGWEEADLVRIRCGFAALAAKFEGNGKTKFLTALAPDKSSAYRRWLVNPKLLPESRIPALIQGFPVPDARLDVVLDRAIGDGGKDIYMPNDTHWGSTGHVLVANAILIFLREQGLAQ